MGQRPAMGQAQQQTSSSAAANVTTIDKTDPSDASELLGAVGDSAVPVSASPVENLAAGHDSTNATATATPFECDKDAGSASAQHSNDTTKSSSHTQRLISELKEADRQINDLNEMIDELEAEKVVLLELVKSGEDTIANATISLEAATLLQEEANAESKGQLAVRVESLLTELESRQTELDLLREEKQDLERDLELLRVSSTTALTALAELQSNFTLQKEDLRVRKSLLAVQDKELADAYKEIGQLEEDFKNVAEPSLRRLRQPSFFSRMLESAFPVWAGGKGSGKNSRRVKGRGAAATAAIENALAMNRTVESLRENLTAMAAALEGKEVAIEELSEQLAERVEEAEKRYKSVHLRCLAPASVVLL